MSKLSLIFSQDRTIKQRKADKKAAAKANTTAVRAGVVTNAGGMCECCLGRPGQSMHEHPPKSVVGNKLKAVTPATTMFVCGSGTTGCHGYLQKHQIVTRVEDGTRVFELNQNYPSKAAARHLETGWALFDRQYGRSDRPTHRMAAGQ